MPRMHLVAPTAILLALAGLVVLAADAGAAADPGVPHDQLDRALAAQYALVQTEPSNAEALNDLGNLLTLAGLTADAENAYARALSLDAELIDARFNLALLQQQRGETTQASDGFLAVLEQVPSYAWAHYQLGVIAENAGDRSKAIERYARAFAADPQLTFARNNPHIIDNRYVAQALIRAQTYRNVPGAQTPRQYRDPERIARLLLDGDASAGDGDMADADADDADSDTPNDADAMDDAGTTGAWSGSAGAAARTPRPTGGLTSRSDSVFDDTA
ncbi:MAG: hypothetical protein AAF772_21225, partial [Acidobacteriota bacterium]